MFRTLYIALFTCLALALTFPVASKAATIEVFDNGYGDYAPMIFNGDPTNGPGVEWILSIDGGPDLIAYCLDIYTPIDYTYYDSTITGPSGFPDGERIAWMYENYAPFVSSDAQAIALQFAIWDVAHDGGDGLNAGSIQLHPIDSAMYMDAANDIVTASLGQSGNARFLFNVEISTGDPGQSLVTAAEDASPVPEPSTVFLLSAALIALASKRHWKRRP